MENNPIYAVIMAGGRGERFWPLGRSNRPKQLLPLIGEETMIEETVQRLFPLFAPEQILVITNCSYVEPIRRLLPIPAENVIGEPVGRDTAPCVALAVATVKRRNPDAVMAVLSADAIIRPAKVFREVLLAATERARQSGALITLGITPSFPSTGYGYIHVGEKTAPGFSKVLGFKEKPDLETADAFLRDGNYKWNSGMFIWQVDAIEKAFQRHCPPLAEKIARWSAGEDFTLTFESCPKISIDYAIMEKADDVEVGDAPFYWNDIGSWSSLRSILPLDANGNAVRGDAVLLDAENNVVIGDRGHLLGVIGMRDVAVIQSGNGTLVCPLSDEQRVKELVKQMTGDLSVFL